MPYTVELCNKLRHGLKANEVFRCENGCVTRMWQHVMIMCAKGSFLSLIEYTPQKGIQIYTIAFP